ncbi:MAG: DHA2 family efflux MFS transporter permease subunit [Solirubrobacterales bacterium]
MSDAIAAAVPEKLFDRRLIQISAVVVLGIIMSILDTTIVNVAIDTLSRDFHTSLSTISWVSTGYLLALASVIPLTGWAADRFGTKRLFMLSILLFLVGSALAGAAWSAGSLIAFRVLQGIGGGMIMPAGMTILTQAAGPQRVGRMMGVIGVPMLLAPIVGPILGGWLVDDVSWRWIFYVNIPIGMVALTLAQRFLDRDEPKPSEKLDWRGLALLSPGVALFVYGLAETGPVGGFNSWKVIAPMVAGALLVGAFIAHALRDAQPLLDVRLFKQKIMAAASLTTFTLAAAFFGAMLLMPLYYQVVRGESALQAGLLIAPQGLGAAVMMPIAGKITDRFGAGRIVPFGLVAIAAGMLSLTQIAADTSYTQLAITLFVLGLGMGATMMPAMSAAFSTMTRAAVPRATSALNVVQRVGGSIGVALLSVVLTHQLTANLPGAGGLEAAQSVTPAMHQMLAPAMAESFGNTYWWGLGLIALAFIPSLFLPRHGSEEQIEIMRASEQRAAEIGDVALAEF